MMKQNKNGDDETQVSKYFEVDSILEDNEEYLYEADENKDDLEVSLRIRIMRDEAISSVELMLVDTNGDLSLPETEGDASLVSPSDESLSMEEVFRNNQVQSEHYYMSMLSQEVTTKQEWHEAMNASRVESNANIADEELDIRSLRHNFWEKRFQNGRLKTKESQTSRQTWNNPSWASIRWEYMESP
jgi:hypothetical protein